MWAFVVEIRMGISTDGHAHAYPTVRPPYLTFECVLTKN